DDRADRLTRLIVDNGAAQMRRQFLGRTGLGTILRWQRRVDATLLRTPFLLTTDRLLLTTNRRRWTQDVERTWQQALPRRLRLIAWLLLDAAKPATRIRLVTWLLITLLIAWLITWLIT